MSDLIIRRLGPEAWKLQHRTPGGRVLTLHGSPEQPTDERVRRLLRLDPAPTTGGYTAGGTVGGAASATSEFDSADPGEGEGDDADAD